MTKIQNSDQLVSSYNLVKMDPDAGTIYMYMYTKIEALTIRVGFAVKWLCVYNRVCGLNIMYHLRNFTGIFNVVYLLCTGYVSLQSG